VSRCRESSTRPGSDVVPPRARIAAHGQRGQGSVEFVALLLLCCLFFGALFALKGGLDGRAFGGFLARHLGCGVSGRCDRDERRLAAAYGERDAATVRALAPNLVFEAGERQLPIDWHACRRPACAEAPDDRSLDAHVTADGGRATAFTRLIRRAGRRYVQYWLNYPLRVWERDCAQNAHAMLTRAPLERRLLLGFRYRYAWKAAALQRRCVAQHKLESADRGRWLQSSPVLSP